MVAKKESFLNIHKCLEAVNENANGGGDNKTKTESQSPDTVPMPADEPRSPQPTAKTTPGVARGFVRNTKPAQGASQALLCQIKSILAL